MNSPEARIGLPVTAIVLLAALVLWVGRDDDSPPAPAPTVTITVTPDPEPTMLDREDDAP